MKRAIIVTWTGVYNYGTSLQSYALQCAVEKLGLQVKILDRLSFENPIRTFYK